MKNFLINKSTTDVGGDITGTTIDGNNRKAKKDYMNRDQGSAPGQRGSIYHAVQVQLPGVMASSGYWTRKGIHSWNPPLCPLIKGGGGVTR